MQKIIFIGILTLLVQFGYSQEKVESNSIEKNIKKTSILGLRTTIYKVSNIEKAKDWYAKVFENKDYSKKLWNFTNERKEYRTKIGYPKDKPKINWAEALNVE
jgi:hypothetical protein